MKTFAVVLCLILAGCATAPRDPNAGWSHELPAVAGPHWVVLRVDLDKSTGAVGDIRGRLAKDALDCLALAKHITKATDHAEIRVCRQIGADGRPIDENKVGGDDQPLHDGEDGPKDVTT